MSVQILRNIFLQLVKTGTFGVPNFAGQSYVKPTKPGLSPENWDELNP